MSSFQPDRDRPPLREDELRADLDVPHGFVRELQVVTEVGSTNAELRERARDGAPEGSVLVAEYQSAGRGRLDRAWASPPRSGLTFSTLLRPRVPARHWPWLPLLVGCAVTDALATSAAVDGRLKWPNDVLVGDRKLCGILLERVETDWGPAAVVGIGLNVTTGEDELPVGATSLRLLGARATDRARLLVTLLRTLGAFYTAWQAVDGTPEAGASDDAPFGPGGLRAAYRARCATVDREVRVELAPGRWLAGLARDIDHDGRLVVATTDRDYALGAGEVVHVR